MHPARGRLCDCGDDPDDEGGQDRAQRGQIRIGVPAEPDPEADAHTAEEKRREAGEPDRRQRSDRSVAASQRRRMTPENGPTTSQ